jgi:methylmalonyl-CoA mutase N-terminal domain/subunit
MDRVAGFGSAVEAIEAGFQKREIEASAYQVAQEIDAGARVVVGVNRFALATEEHYEPMRVDPTIEAAQTARLATLRKERDAGAVSSGLAALGTAAEGTANVLPPMREALRSRATVGEVCDTLRAAWGLYRPSDRL